MKKARFYCENCRKEVRWDAKVCPHCGRFFSAVRCPSCGFTGKSELFVIGCPSCGYAGTGATPPIGRSGAPGGNVDTYSLESVMTGSDPTGKKTRRRLVPSWVYVGAIVALIITLVVLVIVYTRLP